MVTSVIRRVILGSDSYGKRKRHPRFPCCLTWTTSIGKGKFRESEFTVLLSNSRLAHELGWTADSFLRPRGNARSLRKRRAP